MINHHWMSANEPRCPTCGSNEFFLVDVQLEFQRADLVSKPIWRCRDCEIIAAGHLMEFEGQGRAFGLSVNNDVLTLTSIIQGMQVDLAVLKAECEALKLQPKSEDSVEVLKSRVGSFELE